MTPIERAEKIAILTPGLTWNDLLQRTEGIKYIATQIEERRGRPSRKRKRDALDTAQINRLSQQLYAEGFRAAREKAKAETIGILNFKVLPGVSPTMQYPAGYQQGYYEAIKEIARRISEMKL